MTLIASLRTLDGIVIAGDSLATFTTNPTLQGDVDVVCPSCGHKHITQATLTGAASPSTTFSYAQKVFPFFEEYGVGTYGVGQLAGKTNYFAIRELEKKTKEAGKKPTSAKEAAEMIGEYAYELLKQMFTDAHLDISKQPDEWCYNGFQVVGYDGQEPVTYMVEIGKVVVTTPHKGLDVTVNGQIDVAQSLFTLYQSNPYSSPLIDGFALQDAVEYAEFLIRTTALHQRFSRAIPGVGGDIDIALVTPFDKFRWIRQKKLYDQVTNHE